MSDQIPADRLHLDDLHVGQRFTSASHTIDETQIKALSRTAVLRSSSVERSTSVTKSSRHSPPNWSFRADSSKVRPNVVEPGHVRTDLNNNTGFIKPEEGALTAIKMAMIGGDGPTGGFFGSHVRQPW